MTFGAPTRADMHDLLADLQGGPATDAYGTTCFQAVNRSDESTSPVMAALKNSVEMGAVARPDFTQAAQRTNNRLKTPSMQNRVKPPAPSFVGPKVI